MSLRESPLSRVLLIALSLVPAATAGGDEARRADDDTAAAQAVRASDVHRAARDGDLVLLELRLGEGADPDARDAAGRTALLEAVGGGQLDAVRLLLSSGAGVNVASSSGRTPLIEAAEHGQLEAARLLVDARADLDRGQRGWGTALEAAERMGHNDVAALLRKAGARTFGKSIGDTVCVRPWTGDGYCGVVEEIQKTAYRIRVTELVGCTDGCAPRAECSGGKAVGGPEGLQVGDVVKTVSWCLTHTGVKR
jgi:ankyrin repeat protein